MSDLILKDEAYQVIGACFEVHNELGPGFLEAVYQECLAIELSERKIPHLQQPRLSIRYKGAPIEKVYQPDFVCFEQIIIEIKAVSELADIHRAQVINYLRATRHELGLLVNFGSHGKLEHERIVLTNK